MLRNCSVAFLLLIVLVTAGCNMSQQSAVAQPPEQISTPPSDVTCSELVTLAETSVGLVCDALGRNQACYGNRTVNVEFQPDTNFTFQQSGDVVDLLAVSRLSTAPLNRETRDWGIAVLKAQANLPDALPGQNVTFLLFGDTTIDNPTPDMRAVTVSTRIGSVECDDAPSDGILIQSPEGTQVTMNLNGADVTLGSTAFVTTNAETERMTFAVLEGTGIISAFGNTEIVLPGQKTGIPLGEGVDGLLASGPPSEPRAYDPTTMINLPVQLLDRQIEIPPPNDDVATMTPTVVTATPAPEIACTPRADWQFRYVVQSGDNLSIIARKLNMRTADLQTGNCIDNPNRLIAGQAILVPRAVPTNTPIPPTITPTPIRVEPTGPNLRADMNPIYQGACTTIRWDVENIQEVYFEGQPVTGHDAREVCPTTTTTYTLLVILLTGEQRTYTITINVANSCGNGVCETWENSDSCSADCIIIY